MTEAEQQTAKVSRKIFSLLTRVLLNWSHGKNFFLTCLEGYEKCAYITAKYKVIKNLIQVDHQKIGFPPIAEYSGVIMAHLGVL